MVALLGVDIGGTNVKTALVSVDGAVLSFASGSWSGRGPADAVETAALSVPGLVDEAGVSPAVCGCACAGLVDSARGVVHSSPNLPTWSDVRLADMLSERLGLNVKLENDANAAAFAEFEVGAAREAGNAVMLTLGTGVGGGIVLGGALYRGSHGSAGEIGHTTIDLDGAACVCGSRGCLEGMASAGAVVRHAVEMIGGGRESALSPAVSAGTLSSRDVGAAAARGDEVALESLAAVGRNLGVGLANISQILDPDVIVVGGGVAEAGDLLLAPAREEMRARLSACDFRAPLIVAAELGETAGVVGAALLARDGRL
ncbi:MAG: ROK family protein [Candidatus Eisenbacteria bacterium]|nr:ROK family protein [Candidatus Eisenbacteria bacterium]